jgi:hypothetical protein
VRGAWCGRKEFLSEQINYDEIPGVDLAEPGEDEAMVITTLEEELPLELFLISVLGDYCRESQQDPSLSLSSCLAPEEGMAASGEDLPSLLSGLAVLLVLNVHLKR